MQATKRERLIMVGVLLLILTVIFCYPSFSQEKKAPQTQWGHIMFSADEGGHHFFDTSTGTIYEYSSTSGRLRHVWKIEELGEDFIKEK